METKIRALTRESSRLKKKLDKIKDKIIKYTYCGSNLVKAHSNFVEAFNSSSNAKEKLDILEKYEKQEKELKSYFDYDLVSLIDQEVKIEGEIHELEWELSMMRLHQSIKQSL